MTTKMTLKDLQALFTFRKEPVLQMNTVREGKALPALPTAQGIRSACIGGCGAEVTAAMGECRDCRRARIRKGLKLMKRAA